MARDERRVLRERLEELDDAIDRMPGPSFLGSPSMVVKTVTVSSYPTAAASYFAVQSLDVSNTEVEGGSITFTAVGGTFYAFNTGSTIPPSGTKLRIDLVGGRWTFGWSN